MRSLLYHSPLSCGSPPPPSPTAAPELAPCPTHVTPSLSHYPPLSCGSPPPPSPTAAPPLALCLVHVAPDLSPIPLLWCGSPPQLVSIVEPALAPYQYRAMPLLSRHFSILRSSYSSCYALFSSGLLHSFDFPL